MSGSLSINGQIGPYQSGSMPGGYGRNAYFNYNAALSAAQVAASQGNSQPLADLFESSIQFDDSINRMGTPVTNTYPQQQTYAENALGYATDELTGLSQQHQPFLTLQDVQAHAGVQNPFAQNYLSAVDTEKKGYVNPQNEAAYLAFSDVAPQLMSGTLNDLANYYQQQAASHPTDPMSQPAALQEIRQQAAQLAQTPSHLDGTITPAERAAAEWSVQTYPTLTRQILQGIQQRYFSNAA